MHNRSLLMVIMLVFIFSCDDNNDKKVSAGKEGSPIVSGNGQLVYIDDAMMMRDKLCQEWVFADDADGLQGLNEDSKISPAYRSYYFSPAGTYVKDPRNSFEYGKWNYDDAQKILTIEHAVNKRDYKIIGLTAKELKLQDLGNDSDPPLKFIAKGMRLKDASQEPFDLKNNRWRIVPGKEETADEIHSRLKENLHFFILFYKSAIIKKDAEVSFWGLPSCFKWYGGGIYLKKEKDVKSNWTKCFYDKDQAMQAYKLADKLMEKKYTWPEKELWLKQNLAVLEQMYKNLDEIH